MEAKRRAVDALLVKKPAAEEQTRVFSNGSAKEVAKVGVLN
jgi:hypothetical protein